MCLLLNICCDCIKVFVQNCIRVLPYLYSMLFGLSLKRYNSSIFSKIIIVSVIASSSFFILKLLKVFNSFEMLHMLIGKIGAHEKVGTQHGV